MSGARVFSGVPRTEDTMRQRRFIAGVTSCVVLMTALASLGAEPEAAVAANTPPIVEITHRRTGCQGSCAAYSVTFGQSGTAWFRGDVKVEPLGAHKGNISAEDFERLASLAAKAQFFDLKAAYDEDSTGLPVCVTTITRGSEAKDVSSLCPDVAVEPAEGAAPPKTDAPRELLELGKAIDDVRQRIAWKPLERKTAVEQQGAAGEKQQP
jgi:hypothetical protein